MTNTFIFCFPDEYRLAQKVAKKLKLPIGHYEVRHFPDDESYVRIDEEIKNKKIILLADLSHPDEKLTTLLFLTKTMQELGAADIILVAPYLPYMRQDMRFKPGEAVTSHIFAEFISDAVDHLITIDPHLHRIANLNEIYALKSAKSLHATTSIAEWVNDNLTNTLIIGPDEESEQWVKEVAELTQSDFVVAKKVRHGDTDVSMVLPDITDKTKQAVIVDDIISSGTSMCKLLGLLKENGVDNALCIGVHALFTQANLVSMIAAGATEVITCNTIPDITNNIDVSDILVTEIKKLI